MIRSFPMLPAAAFILFTLSGCGSLNTDLAIPEKPLPQHFPNYNQISGNVARIRWRQYFTDKSLQKLIDAAVGNNFDVQIAMQRIQASRASVKMANAALLPEVRLNIGGGVQKFGLYTMDGAGNASTDITPGRRVPENLTDIYLGLQSSWEIDVWGRLRNLRQAATAEYLASVEGTNFVIANLVSDIAIHYNELQALDHQLGIIRQTLRKQQEALEVVQWQKTAGRANELAVQQFKAQLLNSQALEKTVLQKIVETENAVNFLIGRYPRPIVRSKQTFFAEPPSTILAGIPSELLANRPDVRAAEYQIQASQFDLKAAKAAFYPNFNITANLGFQAFNPEFLFLTPSSLAYSLMGNLVAPLINMKALKGRFNTAKAEQLTAMYNYQKTLLNAYVEVANELNNIHYVKQVATLKKQQSETLNEAVEISYDLYRHARANYLEVLSAQQNALQAKLELIDAARRQRLAVINIYKALGGGWK